jgi:cytochrome c551/c552
MKHAGIAAAAGVLVVLVHSTAIAQKVDPEWAKSEAKKLGCVNCHNFDKQEKVGPGWAEVAAKSGGKSPAELATSVKSKPVHASVLKKTNDKGLNQLTQWILTLGK